MNRGPHIHTLGMFQLWNDDEFVPDPIATQSIRFPPLFISPLPVIRETSFFLRTVLHCRLLCLLSEPMVRHARI